MSPTPPGLPGLPTLAARNPRVRHLARLVGQRSARDEEHAFVIDGPVLLAEALRGGLAVEEVFVDPAAESRVEVADVVFDAVAAGARVHLVEGGLAGIVNTATPNALAAVARRPPSETAVGWLRAEVSPLVMVLVGVSDPGNAGTLLRVAEAAGAGAVALVDGSVDPWSPKAVRSSAGSVFRVPAQVLDDAESVLAGLGEHGYVRVAARATGGKAYDRVDLTGPVALVLGSEARGLPASIDLYLDEVVTIPMAGRADSLNVAMAGSVLAFEVLRQRRAREESR